MQDNAHNITAKNISFRDILAKEKPLQITGAVSAYCALLAEQTGFKAIYISGAGVANFSLGLPDLGISTCHDVLIDLERIRQVTNLPILVDIDTGFGNFFNISRSIRQLEQAGANAIHIEDQIQSKRCGHRPNKVLVSIDEMCARIDACVSARQSSEFLIMARTDSFQQEGIDGLLKRMQAYKNAGADLFFPEAIPSLVTYKQIVTACNLPVLANMTEFGVSPILTLEELSSAGIAMALYPLSSFRAMNKAAQQVYSEIKNTGHQKNILKQMQTREELYKTLNYQSYEAELDKITRSVK